MATRLWRINMSDQFERVGDIIQWNKKFLSIGGSWPLESTYIRSTVWIIYLTLHLIMEYAELFANFGMLEEMVNCIVEAAFQTMVLTKFIVIRHSKALPSIINAIQKDFDASNYDSQKEREIFMEYNSWSKLFFKVTIPTIAFLAALYYLAPLDNFFRTLNRNDTNPYVLPFRTRLFFTVNDTRTYLMVFAYQSPMVYVLICHSAWFCLLTTMVFHVCGQLAVLRHRLENLKVSVDNENDDSNIIFGKLAERHSKSIWMASTMDDAFNLLLLQDLVGSTFLLGIVSWRFLVTASQAEIYQLCVFLIASVTFLLLLYAYCVVGECLITESTKLQETYYQLLWYESSVNFRKCLLICLSTNQEPLHLSAGKAYVFCLNGFTDILKTAMGYLSLLRNCV